MSDTVQFLQNAWYVAALSTEVNQEDLFARTILDISIVMYRDGAGHVHALQDRCPHRFAPLSKGHREGDVLVCQYHGLKFDCDGACVHSPHGNGTIPQAAKVRTFPLVERDGFLWIWPGDADKADPATILDCSPMSNSPQNSVAWAYMHNACNYELLTDNIMDLTHIDHLHGPLINTAGKLSPLIPNISENGDSVRARWDWDAHPAMLLLATHLADPEGPAKQFFEVNWFPPSNMTLNVGAVQNSEDYRNEGVILDDYHIMTPETATTTHYFFASTRNYLVEDGEYNRMKMEGMLQAFTEEDKPFIEAQQKEMRTPDLWALNPVLLSSDAGAIRVRRKLQQLIDKEQQARSDQAA